MPSIILKEKENKNIKRASNKRKQEEFNLEEDDTPREFQTEESKVMEGQQSNENQNKTKEYLSVDTFNQLESLLGSCIEEDQFG